MLSNIDTLIDHYNELEKQFPVINKTATYKELVTAIQNQQTPIQRWFHQKEAFSLDLLPTLINEWNIDIASVRRVLDPFCGIGTSLLALQKIAKQKGHNKLCGIGFERNPFLQFIAQTKLKWHEYDLNDLESYAEQLVDGYPKPPPNKLPALSTLHRPDVFSSADLKEILSYKNAIMSLPESVQSLILLGYGSTIEKLSGTRKDGRALRIVDNKQIPPIHSAFKETWDMIGSDIKKAPELFQPVDTRVILGDGRKIRADDTSIKISGNFDIACYSPPYLNNIDYSEVYKLELWMCGFINTPESFRELRLKTLRSHPSIKFHEPISIKYDARMKKSWKMINAVIEALPDNKDLQWRKRLFQGYFDDMYISLKNQMRYLQPGGWIFCIVGNSLHGPEDDTTSRVPIASDIIISLIARELGFNVLAIQIARFLERRVTESEYLRESIIVARKPKLDRVVV